MSRPVRVSVESLDDRRWYAVALAPGHRAITCDLKVGSREEAENMLPAFKRRAEQMFEAEERGERAVNAAVFAD